MGCRVVAALWWVGAIGRSQEPTGQIRGTVTTTEGRPIGEAEIRVVGTSHAATSDSTGWFVIRSLAKDEFVVQVRRIGYKAQQFGARIWKDGEVKEVKIVLERGEYQLPEVIVTARQLKPIEYGWTTRFDDYFRRRQVGLGHYILRDEIERKGGAGRTPSLLAGVRGVRLRYRHPGISGTDVTIAGCTRVSVWIDGNKQRYPELPPAPRASGGLVSIKDNGGSMATGEYLHRVIPSQIEMMEIYRGPSEMPAEFLDDSCAAIAIWTR